MESRKSRSWDHIILTNHFLSLLFTSLSSVHAIEDRMTVSVSMSYPSGWKQSVETRYEREIPSGLFPSCLGCVLRSGCHFLHFILLILFTTSGSPPSFVHPYRSFLTPPRPSGSPTHTPSPDEGGWGSVHVTQHPTTYPTHHEPTLPPSHLLPRFLPSLRESSESEWRDEGRWITEVHSRSPGGSLHSPSFIHRYQSFHSLSIRSGYWPLRWQKIGAVVTTRERPITRPNR